MFVIFWFCGVGMNIGCEVSRFDSLVYNLFIVVCRLWLNMLFIMVILLCIYWLFLLRFG